MAQGRKKLAAAHEKLLEGVLLGAFNHPQQLLAACFTSVPVGLAVSDRKLRYQAIHAFLAKMNGVPAKRHIGKTVSDIPGKMQSRSWALGSRECVSGFSSLEEYWKCISANGA